MQHGYVFRLAGDLFGILTYKPQTQVLCRFTKASSVQGACDELAREFAGHFFPADTDQAEWGRAITKAQDTLLLTAFQGGE